MIYEVLLVAYLIVALLLIGFVLIQQGKGADMGASFGSGGSNTVFGSSGSGNFMTRTTAILAALFFFISLSLGAMTANRESAEDEWNNLEVPASVEEPVQLPADQDVPVIEEATQNDVPVVETDVTDVPKSDDTEGSN
ncbi:protein-export membrane protein secG [Alteromonas macleodii str. 'Black Sea 11']|jgi:preprotein translocase subunit SecG|nr:protein-export membrane protein secG [Alteromonas macleodii str. 'Black Sea 11']NKW89679.1 preprotein translocase subunit SecG [Alteromonadaceae bacterium A_SAG4]NKX03391.1 preprotein translocase subunit SecG [Alteromonadaceae bacterium A_SAG6]NKX18368.1 preprotein translocase subunit SecG [Alteromonadaceae bacterium A_SAG5]NKX34950.1 preprotein translocase subunit SecG [Alteromonadaceae bacterium A_SAG3]|tara:strand:+ start:473 stop:886 length:414 start_codon:yes stop_codon:yes gene_type:complete